MCILLRDIQASGSESLMNAGVFENVENIGWSCFLYILPLNCTLLS